MDPVRERQLHVLASRFDCKVTGLSAAAEVLELLCKRYADERAESDAAAREQDAASAAPIVACCSAAAAAKHLLWAHDVARDAVAALRGCSDFRQCLHLLRDVNWPGDEDALSRTYVLYVLTTLLQIVVYSPLRAPSAAISLLRELLTQVGVRVEVDAEPLRLRVRGLTIDPQPHVHGDDDTFAELVLRAARGPSAAYLVEALDLRGDARERFIALVGAPAGDLR